MTISCARSLVLVATCLAVSVHLTHAHTYFNSLWIDGTQAAQYEYLRGAYLYSPKENPIPNVTVADMKCGWQPYAEETPSSNAVVAAGSTIAAQWWHTEPNDDVMASSHVGPCLAYLAKLDTNGEGEVWFKIYEDGLDTSNDTWCTTYMIYHDGYMPFTIPAELEAGDYILRVEVIALHSAYSINGAQPYVGCAQLTITGTGTAFPSSDYLVAFPGAYSATDPGILFNIYTTYSSYTIPGPALWTGSSSSATASSTTTGSTVATTTGSSAASSTKSTTGSSTSSTTASSSSSSSSLLPTTVSTCGSVTVTKVQRDAEEPTGHNIFDLTVVNSGSAIAANGLLITIFPSSSDAAVQQVWNLAATSVTNQYEFTEAIAAGATMTGAGFIIQGSTSSANGAVQIVCSTTGSYVTQTTTGSSATTTTGSAATTGTKSSTTTTGSAATTGTKSSITTGAGSTTTGSAASSTTTSTCSQLSVSTALRAGSTWAGSDGTYGVYDITITNAGSSAASSVALTISGTVTSTWNLAQSGSQYVLSYPVPAGGSYTGAGIVARVTPTVSLVCASSSATTGSAATTTTGSASTTGTKSTTASAVSTTTGTKSTTTTGSSSNACSAGISFALSQSWNDGGMVSITISNTGSSSITALSIYVPGNIQSWNLVSSSTSSVFTLPSWSYPFTAGAKFTSAGYTYSGSQPSSGYVLSVSC